MLTSAPRPSSPALPYSFQTGNHHSRYGLRAESDPKLPSPPRDQCPRWLDDSDCSLGHMLFKPGVWTYALLKTKMRLTSATRAKVRGGGCFGGLGGKKCIHCYQEIHPPPANTRPFVV